MRSEKSISTDDWIKKYERKFIQKHDKEGTGLDLFHFTVNKLDMLRLRVLICCGLSSFNKAHMKIINKINKQFEDYINIKLSKILNIKKSGEQK